MIALVASWNRQVTWTRPVTWLALVALTVGATAIQGCKKKDSAGVEATQAGGKKPQVVKRKGKDGEIAVPGPKPESGQGGLAKGEVAKPVAPPADPAKALAEATQPAEAVPAAPTATADAPTVGRGIAGDQGAVAPGVAAPGVAAPGNLPPGVAAAAGGALAAPPGRPPRVGPHPLGGADPGVAAPALPDRPAPVPEPAPKMAEPGGPAEVGKPVEPAKAADQPDPAPVVPEMARPQAVHTEPALDITGYLSAADIERVIGARAHLRRGDLPGTPPSPSYNALYFAPSKGDQFGVSAQVWRDTNLAESRTRFNTMRNTYSNVAPTNKIAEQGFRAFYGGVVSLVFADARRPLVASVSCATKVCTADQLIELASRVAQRLR